MAVPYTFGNATTSIPLSQLDTNFATAITIGNTAVQLGNTITTMNNLTLANVTISSAATAFPNSLLANSSVTIGNTAVSLGSTQTSFGNVTLTNVTISSGNSTVSSESISGNLTFTSTGNRITGDFSNATVANRVMFQTSTTNGNTVLNLIPNGTGTTCAFGMDSDPTLTNSSTGSLNLVASTDVRLVSGIRGTGTYLPMTFYTGGSERMRIDSSGNLSVGVASAGGYRTRLYGGNDNTLQIDNDGSRYTTTNIANNGTTKSSIYWDNTNTLLSVYATAASSQLLFGTANTERMRIDSSGNVGIGTTSPTTVSGVALCVYDSSSPRIRLTNSTTGNTSTVGGELTITGSDFVMENRTASANIRWYNNGSERMRIDSSGTLMLGTTSVNNGKANFVRSDNGDCVIQPYANSTTFNNDIIRAVTTRTSGTTEFLFLACYYNTYSSVRAYIRADGNMYNVNGTYGTISDVKLKENIVDATPKLNDLLQLKVRNFNFINDELKTKQLGFVAQEVEQVFPNMVDVSREGNKTIKTSVLIPMLVKAIQEQQAQITSLKAELDALKGTK